MTEVAARDAAFERYVLPEVDALVGHLEQCKRCGLEADVYRRIKHTVEHQRAAVSEESVQRLREFGQRLVEGS